MSNPLTAALAVLVSVWAAGCVPAQTAPAVDPARGSRVVHVAPPTGEKETDRASILAALDEVRPGGTVQFAPGRYLIGEMISVTVPRVTLLGHADGTTLRGCDPEEFVVERLARACNGLELPGPGQTVRGLTFEYAFWALHLGCCYGESAMIRAPDGDSVEIPAIFRTEGGQLVEGNTFRSALSGVRVNGDWTDPAVVRNNRFIDNWHAVSINGNTVHLLDNHISAPNPERVPLWGFPWDGIKIGPTLRLQGLDDPPAGACVGNVVAGNRVEDHLEGIRVEVHRPGQSCRQNVIRDNTVVVARHEAPPPEWFTPRDASDSSFVGVPISIINEPVALGRAGPGSLTVIEDNVIEGNQILGGEGLGVQIVHASGNRIVGNLVRGIEVRTPFPGNDLLATYMDPEWQDANGSGIWVSPGSDRNEIIGNTFEDVAGAAVVLEGDSNHVELRSPSDSVHDLGRGNRVAGLNATPAPAERTQPEWRPVASPDRARVSALAYANGTVFAGTMAGLFASEDLGMSWQLRGPASRSVAPLLPTAEGALLAGTYRQGILRSNDGGWTWSPVGFERNIYIVGMVQDPDGRIYAAVRGAVEDEPTGVFRSSDDGRSWVASGLETEEVYSLSLPRPGLLFAGTRRALFRSEDGGATWSRMGALPSEAPVLKVVAAGRHLYAAMGSRLFRIPGGGVARSADGGRSWEPMEGLPPGTAALDLAVRDGSVLAATGDPVRGGGKGLFRRDEAGIWQSAGLEDAWLRQLIETPDGLFAGAYELGVFHSADGRTWSHRSAGLRNWEPTALRLDAEGLLYALSVRSLFRSADHGQSWVEMLRPDGSAAPTPWSLALDSSGDLYLAGEGGVLVSSDRGESWEPRPIPGEDGQVFALTFDHRGRLFAVVGGKAAYASRDGGRTWEVLDLPAPPLRPLFSSPTGTRFITTAGGFHRRTEGGSWEEVSGEHVWAFTACGDALIAGTYAQGLLRSTDDGRTWSPVTEELRARSQQSGYLTFTAVACLPGGGVLAGTFWDGVFYSADQGTSWVDASRGLTSPTTQDFATSPDGRAFAATPAGVYQWTRPSQQELEQPAGSP